MFHDQLDATQPCPCGSGHNFQQCCQRALLGQTPAATAEALMRSRYTAFALGAVDYLIDTLAPEKRLPGEAELLAEQIQLTQWLGLKILATRDGGPLDTQGEVKFEARFEAGKERGLLRENSRFRRDNGHWLYVDGDVEWLPG